MTNEHIETNIVPSVGTHKKHADWNKMRMHVYDELITLAGLNNIKLSDCIEENLEYAMETVLRYGTYGENAKAIHMYMDYFILSKLLEI